MLTSLLTKLSIADLKDAWRLTVHTDIDAATAYDLELSERLGAELEAALAQEAA